MAPTPLLTIPASAAIWRRLVLLLVSSIVVLLLAGTAFASIGSPRPLMASEQLGMSGIEPGNLPDVSLLIGIGGGAADEPITAVADELVATLGALPGVGAVAAEPAANGRLAVYVALEDYRDARALSRVSATVTEVVPDASVLVGGRAVADGALLDRLNRSLIVAVVPVMVLLAVLTAASVGTAYGLAVAGSVALASLFSGLIGAQVVGRFDGSLATTGVPAVLAGVLVSSVLAFRFLEWFKQPLGDDQAENLRRSVRHLLPETGVLIGGLIVAAVVVELSGAARTSAIGVAAGSIVAAVVMAAVLPSALAMLPTVPDRDDYRLFKLNLPDGRDMPTAILAGFAVFLLCLGTFALRLPTNDLLDESSLPAGASARVVTENLQSIGGDPTSAIVATIRDTEAGGASDEATSAWARVASALPGVGWVETASGRYVDGVLSVVATDGARFERADAGLVVVNPSVGGRTPVGRELRDALAGVDVPGITVALSGVPIDAAGVADGGRVDLALLVGALVIAAGVGAVLLARNLRTALVVAALRLVGVGAALGVYHVVVGSASVAELQLVALLVSVSVGLFEFGILRRVADNRRVRTESPVAVRIDTSAFDESNLDEEVFTAAIRREGRAAIIGVVVVVACGLGLLTSDLEMARRLGVGLAAALSVELLIGTMLLRPALLGTRLGYVSFRESDARMARIGVARLISARPAGAGNLVGNSHNGLVAADGTAGDHLGHQDGFRNRDSLENNGGTDMFGQRRGSDTPDPDDGSGVAGTAIRPLIDPQWRRIVQGLLRAEFTFQNDPAGAELATVFVEGTAVYDELVDHNMRLRMNGFRVVGKGPRLVKAQAIDDSSPVTIAITVDHPERRLLDRDGRLLGVRRPERRDGMLWLAQDPSGRYRIAEAVDLGAALDPDPAAVGLVTPEIALSV